MIDPPHAAGVGRLLRDLADPDLHGGVPRGVIGAFHADGKPCYAYPEIAGYWLRWASGHSDPTRTSATAVVAWLKKQRLASGLWPTRISLDATTVPAHYQQRHYLYDHAMLWDGLRHWAALRRCSQAALLAEQLWHALDQFVVDGRLCAYIPVTEPARDRESKSARRGQEAYGERPDDPLRDRESKSARRDQGAYGERPDDPLRDRESKTARRGQGEYGERPDDPLRDRESKTARRDQGEYGERPDDPLRDRESKTARRDQGEYGVARSGWSSSVGPFLLKACARLLPGRGPLAELCADTAAGLSRLALDSPHPHAHPQLYAIEGLIELDQCQLAQQLLRRLLDAHGGAAAMAEHTGGGPRRSDVLAQMLRVACLLGLEDELDSGWWALATELAARIDRHGRLPFAGHADDKRPTWAGLFALQALQAWSGQPPTGKELI